MLKLDLVNGGGIIKGSTVKITKGKKGNLIFNAFLIKINTEYTVAGIDWQENNKTRAGKVIGSAVIGTVLLGPLGLAAGALAGSKKKDTSTAVIKLGTGQSIYVRCNAKEFQQLTNLVA